MLAAPLGAQPAARIIHENAAHQLRSYGKEVGAVLPVGVALDNHFQIGLVDQRGRLQGMVRALRAQTLLGYAMEFVVNQGDQPGGSCLIAVRHLL